MTTQIEARINVFRKAQRTIFTTQTEYIPNDYFKTLLITTSEMVQHDLHTSLLKHKCIYETDISDIIQYLKRYMDRINIVEPIKNIEEKTIEKVNTDEWEHFYRLGQFKMHTMIHDDIKNSSAYKALSYVARLTLFDMFRMYKDKCFDKKYGVDKVFKDGFQYTVECNKDGLDKTTFHEAINEIVEKRFFRVNVQSVKGGILKRYIPTNEWKWYRDTDYKVLQEQEKRIKRINDKIRKDKDTKWK